ncbi:MAG: FtsX-like permease family protein [Bauldia sp.]
MRTLDRKVLRDLRRLWAQALAIALVVAGGAATIVLSVGSMRSLDETRTAYYERYRFADVFVSVRHAPKTLIAEIAKIPGVAAVDARIAKLALLDIPEMREPATGQFVSLPDDGEPALNLLYLRSGRTPEPGSASEVVIYEGFAKAHAFVPGSRFSAILNGRKRELVVVGIGLSPEFVYAIGPGDRMPDDRTFGVIWMSERALASAYGLEGAFSSVNLKLLRGASEREVIVRLDALLDPYGGQAAYGRKEQLSDGFLEHGLDMLRSTGQTIPPIFFLVAAFLVNLTLGRLVELEREQIGLFKALGYRDQTIAAHYLKFITSIVALGVVIGSIVGMLLGAYITRLYGQYYRFPFLVFVQSSDIYAAAAALSLGAAILGANRSIRDVVRLAPAVAMLPPAPPRFRHVLDPKFAIDRLVSQPTLMMLRNLSRRPLRAIFTTLGMTLATAILIMSLYAGDSMEQVIDVTYFMTDRQDAAVRLVDRRPESVVAAMGRIPGVVAVEPYREVPVRIRYGTAERRTIISGRPPNPDLNRIVDAALRSVVLPETGLALSAALARILGVGIGDFVEIDLLEGQRRSVSLPVTGLVEDYFGLRAMMDGQALSRLMREALTVTSVNLSLDESQLDDFLAAVKRLPTVAGMALHSMSLARFRESLALYVNTIATVYTGLAIIIAFGVVYNSARTSLSERARELASLRVLGFTPGEVFRILVLELAILTLLAQPPAWVIGYGFAWLVSKQLAGELMRAPLLLENFTYVLASAIVIVAATLSALVIRRRVNRLDLVAVLKTRE